MQDLNDLYYFAKVVEAGGFNAEAQRTTRQLALAVVGECFLDERSACEFFASKLAHTINGVQVGPSATLLR